MWGKKAYTPKSSCLRSRSFVDTMVMRQISISNRHDLSVQLIYGFTASIQSILSRTLVLGDETKQNCQSCQAACSLQLAIQISTALALYTWISQPLIAVALDGGSAVRSSPCSFANRGLMVETSAPKSTRAVVGVHLARVQISTQISIFQERILLQGITTLSLLALIQVRSSHNGYVSSFTITFRMAVAFLGLQQSLAQWLGFPQLKQVRGVSFKSIGAVGFQCFPSPQFLLSCPPFVNLRCSQRLENPKPFPSCSLLPLYRVVGFLSFSRLAQLAQRNELVVLSIAMVLMKDSQVRCFVCMYLQLINCQRTSSVSLVSK